MRSRRDRLPRSGSVRGAFLWLLGGALVLLFVWQQAAVDRLVLQLERERDRGTRLTSDVNALRFEVESLAGHVQIAERAEDRLRMTRPEPEQIVGLLFEGASPTARQDAPGVLP